MAGLLSVTDLLVVNEGEAAALADMLGKPASEFGLPILLSPVVVMVPIILVRLAPYISRPFLLILWIQPLAIVSSTSFSLPLNGQPVSAALAEASAAAAIQVTRSGAALAIPTRDEVTAFLAAYG